MRNVERRLRVLERLPQFQSPPSLVEQIRGLALRQISDEDLAMLKNMTRDLEAGVRTTITERESAAMAAHDAAVEVEARRMGFTSFAEAARIEGRRR